MRSDIELLVYDYKLKSKKNGWEWDVESVVNEKLYVIFHFNFDIYNFRAVYNHVIRLFHIISKITNEHVGGNFELKIYKILFIKFNLSFISNVIFFTP